MDLIRQPKGSKLCGQSTIAMLAGITLDESIKLFGHETSTYFKDYTRVLDKLGISYAKKQKVDNRKKWSLPKKAIVRVQYVGRKAGHVVAYEDGKFYDTSNGIYNSLEDMMTSYKSRHSCRVRIDWYMEILGTNEVNVAKAGSIN